MNLMFSSTSALRLSNQLNTAYQSISESSNKLASGVRLNSSADGAADIAIADHFKIQSAEIDMGVRNAQDGMAMMQILDIDLAAVEEYLNKALEALGKGNNELLTIDQINDYVEEANNYLAQTGLLSDNSSYKDIKLLDGSKSGSSVDIQIVDQSISADSAVFSDVDYSSTLSMNTKTSGVKATRLTSLQGDITTIQGLLDTVHSRRSDAGVTMEQIDNATNSLLKQKEGYASAESTIRDTDVAAETAKQVKAQVLYQTASSLFAEMTESSKSRAISIISSAGIY